MPRKDPEPVPEPGPQGPVPVPAGRQAALYERIGALFSDARRHRGLRQALARSYQDASGRMNQQVAAAADRVYLVTAGIPQILK